MKTSIPTGDLLAYERRLDRVLRSLNRDVGEAILRGEDPRPLRLVRSAVREGLDDLGTALSLLDQEDA